MRNISSWAIKHPVPTIVLFILLTVAGIMGYREIRINRMPDIELPVVMVSVAESGAAPSEMETQVTRFIEDAVAGLDNVKHVSSTISDGSSVTTIEFELGTDIDRATNDVRNAVTSARANLPNDIREPVVSRMDITGGAVLTYVVSAPSMTPDQLSWFVDNNITKDLLALQGVSQVQRQGGVNREISVNLDPDRLEALGVTAGSVSSQLALMNINLPGGRTNIGASEQSLRTLGSAHSVKDLANTEIYLSDGRRVRLSELGTVRDSWAEPRSRARFDGKEVVAFNVMRSRGSSEVDMANRVRKEVKKIEADNPGVKITEVTSSVVFVKESFNASAEALIVGAILAVMVVWFFLRDGRATLISAVAIPLSLIPTFAVMALVNDSFNIVSLLALSLTIGVLVDDAIVEIENIVRHMREGKAPYPAALEAADEIGLAVVATSSTIIAVFAPVGFLPGIVGQFFKSFALAACVSVFFSLVVARLLTPLMSAYGLRSDLSKMHDEPRWVNFYLRILNWTLDRPVKIMLAGIVIFALSLLLLKILPTDFVPAGDNSRSSLSIELPPGATLEETDSIAQKATKIVRKSPEVRSVYAAIGASSGTATDGDVTRATMTIDLVPKSERDVSQRQFEDRLTRELRVIPGARFQFGADGNNNSQIQVTLVGDNPEVLGKASLELAHEMRTIPGLTSVVSKNSLARPEILITPKPDKAASLGVSAQAIAQAARIATIGDVEFNLPKFNLADRQIPIRLRLTDKARGNFAVISNLRVPTNAGASVPLSSVATIRFGAGPSQITRLDRERSATVQGERGPGVTLGQADKAVHQLPIMKNLPPGVHELRSGDSEQLSELSSGFAYAIITGILLMYVVLVVLFGSFVHPLTILTALPLALGGAFGALAITGNSLAISALIGLIMLMGIAAKNSILLVEYAIVARDERGLSRRDSLILAARKRARPIVMTTVAMTAGMIPVATGIGANSEFRAPMGIAVIGGLLTSTVLSLVFIPSAFILIDNAQAWLRRRFGRIFKPETELPGEKDAKAHPAE
ncbi:MAG TPA: efflux RND transporter permease subunit [Alphaproteobacteria bacterium]|nr:efflux RND transporter permease subunit [Alphaproteobacteria bacterium]